MLRYQRGGLDFLGFEALEGLEGVTCAVTTRFGGVSRPPFDGLNLGLGGDDPRAVARNLELVREGLGLERLVWLHQVHGSRVIPFQDQQEPSLGRADGLCTDRPGVGLLIKTADCQAVVLVAPGKAVANLHVGWRGNVADFPGRGVEFFCRTYGLKPGELWAVISPSLGPCCAEFVNYRRELPPRLWRYESSPLHFDLWSVTRDQLTARGVRPQRIQVAGLCTKCGREFYSYRRGEPGRFGTVVALGE